MTIIITSLNNNATNTYLLIIIHMKRTQIVNQPHLMVVDTDNLTGLTDVTFSIIDVASGTVVSGASSIAATEIGTTGAYSASWTPVAVGDYVISVASASASFSDNVGSVTVIVDPNTALIAELDANEAKIDAIITDIADGVDLTSAERALLATEVKNALLEDTAATDDFLDILRAKLEDLDFSATDIVAVVAGIEATGGLLELTKANTDTIIADIAALSTQVSGLQTSIKFTLI